MQSNISFTKSGRSVLCLLLLGVGASSEYDKEAELQIDPDQPYSLNSTEISSLYLLFFVIALKSPYHILYNTATHPQPRPVGLHKMSTPNNIPPYTPMPSLGHELGVMFGFIVACLLIMAVYIYFWRGMAIPPHSIPQITPGRERLMSMLMKLPTAATSSVIRIGRGRLRSAGFGTSVFADLEIRVKVRGRRCWIGGLGLCRREGGWRYRLCVVVIVRGDEGHQRWFD